MNVDSLPPRYVALLGLLALIPVLAMGAQESTVAGVTAFVNVIIIVGVLYLSMGATTPETEPDGAAA